MRAFISTGLLRRGHRSESLRMTARTVRRGCHSCQPAQVGQMRRLAVIARPALNRRAISDLARSAHPAGDAWLTNHLLEVRAHVLTALVRVTQHATVCLGAMPPSSARPPRAARSCLLASTNPRWDASTGPAPLRPTANLRPSRCSRSRPPRSTRLDPWASTFWMSL